jgi:hypothetical protein
MGAQDSFSFAEEFRQTTGTTSFLMIWDEGFDSWAYYGVRGQPTAILVDPSGEPLVGWSGVFDEDEVLELASQY